MIKLMKVSDDIIREKYEGTKGDREVVCILDENCVRYMVFENGKLKARREFSNGKEKTCFRNAEKALNK